MYVLRFKDKRNVNTVYNFFYKYLWRGYGWARSSLVLVQVMLNDRSNNKRRDRGGGGGGRRGER